MQKQFRDEWLVPLARESYGVSSDFIDAARGSQPFLASALIRAGVVSPDDLGKSVSSRYGCRVVRPNPGDIDSALLSSLSERICRQHLVLPVAIDSSLIRVATANPLDVGLENEIRFAAGRRASLDYCTPDHLEELIARLLNHDQLIFDLLRKVEVSQTVELVSASSDPDATEKIHAPLIRLVNSIIAKAIELKASDIHLEHEERSSQVRYRVDGILRTSLILPRYLAAGPVASRLKIMAKMDVTDRRHPQDGQARIRVGGAPISLRISTLPTQFGEKVVARVLDPRNTRGALKDLGLRDKVADTLKRQLDAEQGLILVTGPTGSGKTTTLYAAIASLADGETNIVSIEDPIEYQLSGINQVQIDERKGLTFASVLRSVLRQDPDVIFVGEIRDKETADIACQAAMTGHLVLSTLHTNDATAALARLNDMGVDRFKVLSSLRAVTAQRLVRRLCACRRPSDFANLPESVRHAVKSYGLAEAVYEPVGCAACQFSGFAGRVLLAEILEVTPALATAMEDIATATKLRAKAIELQGLEPIDLDALWHLTQGHTTLEEVAPHLMAAAPFGKDPKSTPEGASTAPTLPAVHVLIADDDVERQARIDSLLRAAGHSTDMVADGPSTVARMALQPPDALVVAATLPLLSGVDIIRYVRTRSALVSLPIVAIHEDHEAVREQLVAAGANEVLAESMIDICIAPLVHAALARGGDFSPAREVMTARIPPNESERLAALQRTRLLDSPAEERFSAITRLAARTFNVPIAVVTLVDQDRQWFKASEGLAVSETPRDQAFCAHAILQDDVMVVGDAVLDTRFSENPLVTDAPNIRFYAGCPVSSPDGQHLGTLCVIDREPRQFSDNDKQTLRDLGKLVEQEIARSGAGRTRVADRRKSVRKDGGPTRT